MLKPASIHSKTHQTITAKIARNHVKEKKIKTTVTVVNPETKSEKQVREWNESNKLQQRQTARRQRDSDRSNELTADFLDAKDDDDLDGNLGDIRRRYKEQNKRAASGTLRPRGTRRAKKRKVSGSRRSSRREWDDDDDDEGDDVDDDEESGEEEETEEDRKFIVRGEDDGGGEGEYSDEDEFEEGDDDDDD